MLKNKQDIPAKPGVYLFKKGEKVLYIGKAKNLTKRVSQYFQGRDHLVIDDLLSQADDLECIVTKDETDALLLEYNLIHSYRPPFNVRLKDDKSFPFIEITLKNQWPGIYFSRRISRGNYYAGPITNAGKAKSLIDAMTRVFKLRACSETTFKRGIACLYFHIDRCTAPCTGNVSQEEYRHQVNDAVDLLKGKRKKILDKLTGRMKKLAENLEFEAAQETKGDIELLKRFTLESYISSARNVDYDVLAFHLEKNEGKCECFVLLLSVESGHVKRKKFFDFDSLNSNPEEVLKDFLISFYSAGNIPPQILVRFLPVDKESIEELFTQLAGRNINIKMPLKGDKYKMLNLAAENLSLFVNKTNYSVIGARLQKDLRLRRFPTWIEGFDISHFSERDRVGAAVAFSKGVADRKKYRNYLIKNAPPGDTEALKEVLERRFKRAEEFPDLLLIDGGKGQLSAALEIKKKLNLPCDVVAIAKEEERVFRESGGSVLFPTDSPERFLLQNIRDEVHRRAITHHRKRRQKLP